MITKVSEITKNHIAKYIKLEDPSETDLNDLDVFLKIAKKFIKNYTGLSDEELDKNEDFIIVIYILCQDMYDNRSYYVDNNNLNKTVTTILDMNSRNLL